MGASATSNAEAYINQFMTEAESFINASCMYNFSDKYTTLNVDVKAILKECASCLAATSVIMYDMSGYSSIVEAQTLLDVLRDRIVQCMKMLKERPRSKFIQDA